MDYNFDTKFMTDDELEQAMDEFIDSIKDDINNDESKTTVLNALRLKQLQFAHAALHKSRNKRIPKKYPLLPFR